MMKLVSHAPVDAAADQVEWLTKFIANDASFCATFHLFLTSLQLQLTKTLISKSVG